MTDDSRPTTTRRTALRKLTATTIGLTGFAGCASDSGEPVEGTSATEPPDTRTATPTSTAVATDTEAETATRTETATGTEPETVRPAEADYTVGMYTELYFDPVGLFVEPGDTVAFELVSGAHSATAYDPANENALDRRIPEGAPAWDTGTFGDVGTARSVTFETVGTHDYYCIPHKMVGMVGRIVVGSPGGPAEESKNPDLALPDSARIVEEGRVAWADWEENV